MAPPRKGQHTGAKPGAAPRRRRLTRAEMEHALNTMRQRLAPQITDRRLMQTYLENADLDIDRAVNQWQDDRDRIIAGIPIPGVPDSVQDEEKSEGGEDEEEEEEEEEEEADEEDGDADGEDDEVDADKDAERKKKQGDAKAFKAMQNNRIAARFNNNPEQERRDAALAFRIEVEEASMSTVIPSPSQAILFLYLCGWDLGMAVARWNSATLRENYELLGQFDRMREPLRRAIDVENRERLLSQDERLALLLNITGRPDWNSIRERLIEADFNLIEALTAWFRPGIRPERPAQTNTFSGIRFGVNMREVAWPRDADTDAAEGTVLDEGWGREPNLFMPDNNPDLPTEAQVVNENDEAVAKKEESASAVKDKDVSKPKKPAKIIKGTKPIERRRRNGFLIHIDSTQARETAQVGVPNPQLFLVEWIAKQRYWSNRFKHKSLRFPELERSHYMPPRPNRPEFDWNSQAHINLLNNWRRQAIIRVTGFNSREGSQKWSQEEIDFLVSLTEELLDEAKNEFPGKSEDELLPLVVTTKKKVEWARRFNEKFTGTTQPGSDKPRVDRKFAALMTQRGRIQLLVDRYKCAPDKKWYELQERKEAKAGQKRKREPSEEEEEPAEGDETAEVEETAEGEDVDDTVITRATEDGDADDELEEELSDADDKEE